eukprot:2024998-Rhodomonas_salina.1
MHPERTRLRRKDLSPLPTRLRIFAPHQQTPSPSIHPPDSLATFCVCTLQRDLQLITCVTFTR